MRGRKLSVGLVAAWTMALGAAWCLGENFERWEEAIAAFEAEDAEHPPEAGGVLFAGSSSIVGWDVERWFDGFEADVVKRGFGGSHIADSVHFGPRIIHPHRPEVVVLYAGDNDVAAGKSPERVLADFEAFVDMVREASPQGRVIFISIKPSTARWELVERIREANALVQGRCADDERLFYADIFTPTLNDEGEPAEVYLAEDGLHLTEAGYEKWTEIVRPLVERALEEAE